jgi:glycosyl hydrolase family 65
MSYRALGGLGAILLAFVSVSDPSADPALRLWYRQPGGRWSEALLVGNGRLGAMVFGGVAEERRWIRASGAEFYTPPVVVGCAARSTHRPA